MPAAAMGQVEVEEAEAEAVVVAVQQAAVEARLTAAR